MTASRRQLLGGALAAALAGCPAPSRAAGDWPQKPVRFVVPYAAGGPVDVAARLIGDWLGERWGQRVLLDNRPGAGGNLGSELVARAAPDGATFLVNTSSIAIAPSLYRALPFDVARDLAPVSLICTQPTTLIAVPELPAATLPALLALARQRPGQLTFGSGGQGTTNHMAGELLKHLAGIDLVHVPYRGTAPAFTALMAGEVQLMFASTIETLPLIRAGRVRALAVTNAVRATALPDLPTIAESVPGYESTIWYALFAPAGLPAAVTARLTADIAAAAGDPALRARFDQLGATLVASPPAALADRFAGDMGRWAAVAAAAGLRID